MAMAAVAAHSAARARQRTLSNLAAMESRPSPDLTRRRMVAYAPERRVDEAPSPAWSASTDEALIEAARDAGAPGERVHWGDVARAVTAVTGVVCTAKECRDRHGDVAPTSLLGEARARSTWFGVLQRRPVIQVAVPVGDAARRSPKDAS